MPTEAYRPRRPAATLLHRTVREHLEIHIAFILDAPIIERILTHFGEPATPPAILPARANALAHSFRLTT
jgi:hypothetical protein